MKTTIHDVGTAVKWICPKHKIELIGVILKHYTNSALIILNSDMPMELYELEDMTVVNFKRLKEAN
jgi:hypothetical protein